MSDSRFFADVQQTAVPTSTGPCDLPILYKDASLLGIFFRVDPAKAAATLEGTPFEPFVVFGKAVVLLALFEYRDTTVGVYNELGLAVLAKRAGTSPGVLRYALDMKGQEETGLYVTNLPVTTREACAAGVEIWGYPKYVTGIGTSFTTDGVEVTLQDELRIRMGRGRGPTTKGLPFITWTVKDGRMIRTVIDVGHRTRWGGAGSVQIDVLGDGPTADTARALGIDGSGKAAFAFRTDAMRAILPTGQDMGEAAGATSTPQAAAA